jgi:hypothetical protein
VSRVEIAVYSPWFEASCVQMCGWKPERGQDRAEADAVAHTKATGHETAVTKHESTHYVRAAAPHEDSDPTSGDTEPGE